MAQTSQDVFDTATGKHKLFPQGSRLVGTYSSEVAYGQARVLVAWQRCLASTILSGLTTIILAGFS